MLIKGDTVLLQVPKNASITLQSLAKANTTGEIKTTDAKVFMTVAEAQQQGGVLPENASYVVVTRNPYDRVFSAFLFNKMRSLPFPMQRRMMARQTPPPGLLARFERFVLTGLEKRDVVHPFFYPMTYYVEGAPADKLTLVKLEDTDAFKQFLSDFFGVASDAALPQLRRTLAGSEYSKYYSADMIAKVNELYADDFSRFGYTMIDPATAPATLPLPVAPVAPVATDALEGASEPVA